MPPPWHDLVPAPKPVVLSGLIRAQAMSTGNYLPRGGGGSVVFYRLASRFVRVLFDFTAGVIAGTGHALRFLSGTLPIIGV